MSQQNSQTGVVANKPAGTVTQPAQKSAPLPLAPAQLQRVSGGIPRTGW